MIDEAWRAVRDAALGAGARDGTIPAGLAAIFTVLAVATLAGMIELLARSLAKRKAWRRPTRRSTAALHRKLIRPLIPGRPYSGLPEGR